MPKFKIVPHLWYARDRGFELVDEGPAAPRFSLRCQTCGFTYPGSWSHIDQDPRRVRTCVYGKPFITDEQFASVAQRSAIMSG